YAGNFDAQGRRLDPRVLPRGSELTWLGFWIPPEGATGRSAVPAAWRWGENTARWFSFPIGQGKPFRDVQLTVEEFERMAPQAKYYEPLDPDLRAFHGAGGRLMIYAGWEDWGVTYSQVLMYYDAVRRAAGWQEAADRFVRLFLVPGMSHCAGGPTPDTAEMLLQLVQWVEQGQAPEQVMAHDTSPATKGARRRPVFRYPLEARYTGPDPKRDPSGPDKAENFVAAPPARARKDSIDWVGEPLLTPGAGADWSRVRQRRR
ncbi:MAG: tannase/feruloyl esterase family alpha/beta hydrolase, partial [Bryobacteraceae bacterium]|nr:tannase/feruloyl esterase family alpha/beta hydrolase [Bryobacteraceae bacterium]